MTRSSPSGFEPIAVVGVSALFPGSSDATGFWTDILSARDLLQDVPPTHWLIEDWYDPDPTAPDKTYARRGGFLSPTEFDPLELGLPPNAVPATDSSQILGVIMAQRVLEDATRGQFTALDRDRVSVILGVAGATPLLAQMIGRLQRPQWLKALRESGMPESEAQAACDRIAASYVPWQEATFPGLLGNVVAGRIANRLDLGGTNCVIDAACASSLGAVAMAVNELRLGTSDLVITGGVDVINDVFMYMCFSKTPALSPTGDIRPFSDKADGTMLGEGVCMLALRRLSDAERDGNRIYAVMRGMGSSSDGRFKSIYAPRPDGQAKALRRAYEAAGYGPETVELVEAHGTGTKAGDAAEFESLRMVFDESGRTDRQWCALGSVKSQIGHTKGAAGAAGLFKAVMALHHKVLPPTAKVDAPNPALDLPASPLYLGTCAAPWIRDGAHPRRASVSAFGFGGSNFHATVEEYTGARRAGRLRTAPSELIVLAAATREALAERCRALAQQATRPGALRWLAYTTQRDVDAQAAERIAIVATDESDLEKKLLHAAGGKEGPGIYRGGGAAEPVAFLFPGQGSQYVRMGSDLAMAWDEARAIWDRTAARRFGSERLDRVVFPRPAFNDRERAAQEATLMATEWAQPAIGVASRSMLDVLRVLGVAPQMVGGHSFGEITALHAAGVLDEEAFIALARRRGELVGGVAQGSGAMLAVAHPVDELLAILAEDGFDVTLANHNGPRQAVLSGPSETIDRVEQRLVARKLQTKRLPVATAFHSPMIAPVVEPLGRFLSEIAFAPAQVPVYANSEARAYPADPEAMRALLAGQVARPVRFAEQIEAMYAAGARTFVEVGPGSVLSGLVSHCLEGRSHRAIATDRKGQHGLTSLWHALGQLHAAGVGMVLARLWEAYREPEDPARAKRPAISMTVIGQSAGRLYPPAGGVAALPKPNPERSARVETPPPPRAEPAPGARVVASQAATSAPASGRTEAQASATSGRTEAQASATSGRAEAQASGDAGLVGALLEMQRQTAEAQTAFQKAMTESHLAYLRVAETFAAAGSGVMTSAVATPSSPFIASKAEPAPMPASTPIAVPPSTPSAPLAAAPTPTAPARVTPKTPATAVAAPAMSAGRDLTAVLFAIVADKTGYPEEILRPEMELEAGLGIDSIKRVEILSAMQERVPELPEVPANELATLRTLGEIVDYMSRQGTRGAAAPPSDTGAPAAARHDRDLTALLLAIVADKTGYPEEVLTLDMELEAGLGIDSIKRVEILSAMQEQAPELPEVPASQLAALRTLGEIVAHMERAHGTAAAPSAAREAVRMPGGVARAVVEMTGMPAAGLALRGLFAGPIAIIDDGAGLAHALASRLAAGGVRAEVAEELPAGATGLVFLGGLAQIDGEEGALAVNRRAFGLARALAAQSDEAARTLVVMQDTGGDFGRRGAGGLRAWLGGLAGLAKTAAVEWPKASVKVIDLECAQRSPDALADAVVAELISGGADVEVGLREDGARLVPALVQGVATAERAPAIGSADVIVASGGARGVTAAALLALAEKTRARFVLLGRTRLEAEPAGAASASDAAGLKRLIASEVRASGLEIVPAEIDRRVSAILGARETRATLAAFESIGAEARYYAVDVQDRAALVSVLNEVRRDWGPVTGIVHGAGVLADKLIAQKTDAQFDRVFDTKTRGLLELLRATHKDPLRLICLFSSIAARAGNVGQCDYAMANDILNQVAWAEAAARGPACVVKAIGWGPWRGGMVTAALERHFTERGVGLIPLEAGARAFVDELLASPTAETEVIVQGEGAGMARPPADESSFVVPVSRVNHPYIASHVVRGEAVVPAVLAAEWMARAALTLEGRPRLSGEEVVLRDLKVLRGIRLTGFDQGAVEPLTVTAQRTPEGIHTELRSAHGVHYSAVLDTAAAPPPRAPLPIGGRPWPWRPAEVYDGVKLFHGPAFQAITALETLAEDGGNAQLARTSALGWPGERFLLDPALIDGGLQLALLWAYEKAGRTSLPTRIERIRVSPAHPDEPLRCTFRTRLIGAHRTVTDLSFATLGGVVVAEMSGVEMTLFAEEGRREAATAFVEAP